MADGVVGTVPVGTPGTTDGSGVNAVAFSADGKLLATGDDNGGIALWRLTS